jgi:hypothetical protein
VCEGLAPYYDLQDFGCTPSLCLGFCAAAFVLVAKSRGLVVSAGFLLLRELVPVPQQQWRRT